MNGKAILGGYEKVCENAHFLCDSAHSARGCLLNHVKTNSDFYTNPHLFPFKGNASKKKRLDICNKTLRRLSQNAETFLKFAAANFYFAAVYQDISKRLQISLHKFHDCLTC
jgi:hypothetical protein